MAHSQNASKLASKLRGQMLYKAWTERWCLRLEPDFDSQATTGAHGRLMDSIRTESVYSLRSIGLSAWEKKPSGSASIQQARYTQPSPNIC